MNGRKAMVTGLAALLLSVVVLLQAGQGGGLAAMGGGGGTESFVGGRQAVTILTRSTWWLGGIFLVLSLVLSVMSAGRSAATSDVERLLQQPTQQAPVSNSPLPLGGTEPAPAAETPAAPQPQPQP